MQLVRDAMTRSILYVTPDATVRTAVEMLRSHQADVISVVEGGQVIGVLDALHLCLYDGEVSVQEAISEPPLVLTAEMPLADAASTASGCSRSCVSTATASVRERCIRSSFVWLSVAGCAPLG